MDQNFQTSFIPKKPILEQHTAPSRAIGFLFFIAIFILFIVLSGTGGLYLYKKSVQGQIVAKKASIDTAQKSFEPSKIEELQLLDKRLSASKEVLSNHIMVTPIFNELQTITMHTVRFTKFTYAVTTEGSTKIDIKMSGIAVGYRALALQSDLFGQDKNFNNPVFSNLTLDNSGNVTFDLEFSVSPTFVNYEQTIKAQN